MEIEKEELGREIEIACRIHSGYTRRNKLLREMYVKFMKRAVRDTVLREMPLMINGNEVRILKEVPWKEYHFFSSILRENGITYQWLIPEGFFPQYESQRYNIN